MTPRALRWQELARIWIGHWLSRPFHRVFNLIPHVHFGLSHLHVSHLKCAHPLLAGRRAIHLSDLHLDRYLPRHDEVVQTAAALRPDWIFITGDLINVRDGLPHLLRFLAELRKSAPVFVVLGNHDYYSGVRTDEFAEAFDRHKIILLINQVSFLTVPGGELAIVGLDDPSLHRADLGCIPSAKPDRYTLLLAHAPSILDQLHREHHVDLGLCGHSHAGQWRIPFVPTFWLPPGCNGRLGGLYEANGHRLYVNRGLGWSVLPMRLNCAPEMLLIEWT
ncbi:MAG TPA: metallophosphoesterase [Nitrospiraceae bacterium]|nr:metallophosphoesterase [Nitrospiraceae bacterium]